MPRYSAKRKQSQKRLSKKPKQLPELKDQKREEKPIDLVDDRVRQAERQLGDLKLAKKVVKLQDEFPAGTLPELTAMEWLRSRHHTYFYQVEVLGGRPAGGLVPDFVLPRGGEALALLVHGTYWHEGFAQKQRDATSVTRIKGSVVFGHRITDVVEVWDTKLFDDRTNTMNAAVAGVGLGQ